MEKRVIDEKMVLRYQYNRLGKKQRIAVREKMMQQAGMSYPAFYIKLKNDAFRPLEQELMQRLMQEEERGGEQ